MTGWPCSTWGTRCLTSSVPNPTCELVPRRAPRLHGDGPGRGWGTPAGGLQCTRAGNATACPARGQAGGGGATGSGLPPLTPLSPLQRRKAPHEGVYNVSRGPISLGELGEGREEGRLRPRPASPRTRGKAPPLASPLGLLLLVLGQPRPPQGRVVPSGWASRSCRQELVSSECCPSGKALTTPVWV